MFKRAKPLFLIVETPLHAGSGTDLGIVDLPIQREKHTDYPKIEASGLKGAIREIFRTQPNLAKLREWGITSVKDDKHTEAIDSAFGPDTSEQNNPHAGALGFTDARLLLFPVKSVKGVFAWVTCPAVLERFKQDLFICRPCITFDGPLPGEKQVPIADDLIVSDSKIVLEEYTFEVEKTEDCERVANWIAENCLPSGDIYDYWRDKIRKSLVVLSNDDFRDFVRLSTEVIARIKIDPKTGTVEKGALWYEEYLPSDSILYSLALASPIFKETDKGIFAVVQAEEETPGETESEVVTNEETPGETESEKVMNFFSGGLPRIIQIGGNATIGKGIVRTKVYGD